MQKLAFLFPGQGSQYVGMGRRLFKKFKVAQKTFEEASDILGFSMQELCFYGNSDRLNQTENTQPAILTVSIAAYRVYMEELGMNPSYCAGHSLGEISALTCAKAIDFCSALKLVKQRGRFMQEAANIGSGAMAVISGIGSDIIEDECVRHSIGRNIVVISNYNSEDQIVISGNSDAVHSVVKEIKNRSGVRTTLLKVSAPFHTPIMHPAAESFKEELQKYSFCNPKYPVISNVDCRPYTNKNEIVEKLVKQMLMPVRWQGCIGYLMSKDVNTVLEIGPKSVLINLIKGGRHSIKAFPFENPDHVEKVKMDSYLQDATKYIPNIITKCMAMAVGTRNSNWDDETYHKGVIKPYRKIKQLYEEIEKKEMFPDLIQMRESLEMLRLIFETKKISIDEQVEIFGEIFKETGTMDLFTDFQVKNYIG